MSNPAVGFYVCSISFPEGKTAAQDMNFSNPRLLQSPRPHLIPGEASLQDSSQTPASKGQEGPKARTGS